MDKVEKIARSMFQLVFLVPDREIEQRWKHLQPSVKGQWSDKAESLIEVFEELGYHKPKDRPELRMEIHRITSLLARRTVGEASKKNLSGIVVTRFNDEADTEILALIPDKLPPKKPPLLSDEKFIELFTEEQKRQGVPDKYNIPEAIAGNVHYHRMLAQAQREVDIKFYSEPYKPIEKPRFSAGSGGDS